MQWESVIGIRSILPVLYLLQANASRLMRRDLVVGGVTDETVFHLIVRLLLIWIFLKRLRLAYPYCRNYGCVDNPSVHKRFLQGSYLCLSKDSYSNHGDS